MPLNPACAASNAIGFVSGGIYYATNRIGYIPIGVSPALTSIAITHVDGTAITTGATFSWFIGAYALRVEPYSTTQERVVLDWAIDLSLVSDQSQSYQVGYTLNGQSSTFCIYMPNASGALAGNKLFLVDNDNDIWIMNTDGTSPVEINATLSGPIASIKWHQTEQKLYVNDNGHVRKMNADGTVITSVHDFGSTFGYTLEIHPTIGGSGAVWAGGTGGLKHWDIDTSTETTLHTAHTVGNGTSPSLRHDGVGTLWYYRPGIGTEAVWTADDEAVGSPTKQFDTPLGDDWYGFAYDVANNHLYYANATDQTIARINDDGTGDTNLVTTYVAPRGVEIDTDLGKIFYSNNGGDVSKADLDGSNAASIRTHASAVRVLALAHVNQT